MSRDKMQLFWADKVFVQTLKELRAKRQICGFKDTNMQNLTNEIVNSESWKKLEAELLKRKDGDKVIRIRMDWDWK